MTDLLANARELHGVFSGIAMVLVFAGVIFAAARGMQSEMGQSIRTVTAAGLIAVVIVAFPGWVDELQLMAHSVVKQIDADPAESHRRFASLIAGPGTSSEGDVGFWDVLWADQGGIGKAVLYAIILLFGKLALAVEFLCFFVQQLIVTISIAVSPIFLGMLMLATTREIGVKFLLSLVAVISWPLGWAVADVVTSALLSMAAGTQGQLPAGESTNLMPGQGFFVVIVLSLWILLSTIASPYAISKALQAGSQMGSGLLGSVGAGVGQGTSYAIGAGATAAVSGASGGKVAAAAGVAGMGGMMSGAAGSTGMVLPAAIGTMAVMAGTSGKTDEQPQEASEIVKQERKRK